MPKLTILTLQRISAEERDRIEAVDPAIRLIDAGGWFDGEYRETWPAFASARYLSPRATGCSPRRRSFLAAGRFRSTCAPGRRG